MTNWAQAERRFKSPARCQREQTAPFALGRQCLPEVPPGRRQKVHLLSNSQLLVRAYSGWGRGGQRRGCISCVSDNAEQNTLDHSLNIQQSEYMKKILAEFIV